MSTTNENDLARYLRETGTTQKDFAELIGGSQQQVQQYATGKVVPRPEMMRKIIEATNGMVTVASFY